MRDEKGVSAKRYSDEERSRRSRNQEVAVEYEVFR